MMKFPIFLNHDSTKLPIGTIELDNFYAELLAEESASFGVQILTVEGEKPQLKGVVLIINPAVDSHQKHRL